MANYKANSENSKNVILKLDNQKLGELRYQKWYSFNAEIELVEGEKYQLEPKGFWDAKIELKKGSKTLLDFKMGWKGIMIRTFFNASSFNFFINFLSTTVSFIQGDIIIICSFGNSRLFSKTGFMFFPLKTCLILYPPDFMKLIFWH